MKNNSQQVLKDMSNQAQNNSNNYDTFLNIFKDALDDRASIKRKHLRSKNSPFMNENIFEGTMY